VPDRDLSISQLRVARKDSAGVLWVDLREPTLEETETVLGDVFGFHPLTIEDCRTMSQRPKVEDFGEYLFLVMHAPPAPIPAPEELGQRGALQTIEFNLYLGRNFVVTYHSLPVAAVEQMRETVSREGRYLAHGADYVAAEVLQAVAGDYIVLLDAFDDQLEWLETEIFTRPQDATVRQLFLLRRRLAELRRTVSPQREVLNRLAWDTFEPVREETRLYFREAYDRLVRVADLTENLRDLASGALETYLSVVNNQLNVTMRWLAAVSTLFLPLTLIASIYGMNFADLPPFQVPGGWRLVMGAMLAMAAGALVYFRRRGLI
jgi:magnesium transporter